MATPACAAQRAGRGPAARPKQAFFSTSQRPWCIKLPTCARALSFWAEEAAVWLLTLPYPLPSCTTPALCSWPGLVFCLGLGAQEGYLGFFEGRGTTRSPRWPKRTASLPWDQACRPLPEMPICGAWLRAVSTCSCGAKGQLFWFSSPSCCGKPRSLGYRWGYPGSLQFSSV